VNVGGSVTDFMLRQDMDTAVVVNQRLRFCYIKLYNKSMYTYIYIYIDRDLKF